MILVYEHPLSPYAQKVKIALAEKGIPFETKVPEAFGSGAVRDETFKQQNPRHEAALEHPRERRAQLLAVRQVARLVPEVHPQQESYWGHVNPIGPRSCYDEGKRCAETLFFDYSRQHNLKIKVLRIFNTYGPRMQPNDGRVVSNFIIQALDNQPITIYGDGQQTHWRLAQHEFAPAD